MRPRTLGAKVKDGKRASELTSRALCLCFDYTSDLFWRINDARWEIIIVIASQAEQKLSLARLYSSF